MTWVAAGVTVAATLYSADQQASAQRAQAGQARVAAMQAISEGEMDKAMRDLEAKDIMSAASREADQIKRQAMQMRGSIIQAQSGSGAVIGEGSAQAALDQLDMLSSADALAALYSGVNKSVATRASGRFAAQAGANKGAAMGAAAASYESAANATLIGGLLNAGAAGANGYAKSQTPKITTTGTTGTK